MRGSITKKKSNDLYYPVVYLGKDNLTGKKKYKWGHGYKSKKEAEKELRQLLNAYDNDDSVLFIGHKEYSTFNEVFLQWKDLIVSEGLYESGTSYDTCVGNIQKHIVPSLGEARIDKIELKHIRQVFSDMKKSDGTPLSNATKKKILGTLRHIFDYGIESGWLTENPCADVKIKSPETPPKTIWSSEEITYFLDWVKAHREYHYYLAFLILATTAGRRGEITAIRYQDIMDNGGLFITRSVKTNGEVKDTKTGTSGRRVVMLFEEAEEAIKAQTKRQQSIIEKYGSQSGIQTAVKPWDRIITDNLNNPVNPQYLSREFKRCVDLINKEGKVYLPPMPMKNLRHSFATIGLQNGVNVPDMQRQLGHSRASTTQNSYNQYAETMQKANRDKMERLYFGGNKNGSNHYRKVQND